MGTYYLSEVGHYFYFVCVTSFNLKKSKKYELHCTWRLAPSFRIFFEFLFRTHVVGIYFFQSLISIARKKHPLSFLALNLPLPHPSFSVPNLFSTKKWTEAINIAPQLWICLLHPRVQFNDPNLPFLISTMLKSFFSLHSLSSFSFLRYPLFLLSFVFLFYSLFLSFCHIFTAYKKSLIK